MLQRRLAFTLPWNLFLLTFGAFLIAYALKTIAVPHEFISGGVSGLGLLLYYAFPVLDPGVWYYLLNIPLFIAGWFFISRRFFFYTLYGTTVTGLFLTFIQGALPISDPLLAVLACGTIYGAGAGIALRSLGSTGGVDIIAVFLNQRYNMGIGQVYFLFNLALFGVGLLKIELQAMLYSLAMIFLSSQVTDYFLRMFNQRKMALIITDHPDDVVKAISEKIHRGCTLLQGMGAYSGKEKRIVLTVVHNMQVKRLQELVDAIDPHAFTIISTTWDVLGMGFSTRKVY